MTTLNIPALRETQQSIANPELQFNMANWTTCIYAHAKRANGLTDRTTDETAAYLGLPDTDLFYLTGSHRLPNEPTDRAYAVNRIEALIAAARPEPQPELEPELELACV